MTLSDRTRTEGHACIITGASILMKIYSDEKTHSESDSKIHSGKRSDHRFILIKRQTILLLCLFYSERHVVNSWWLVYFAHLQSQNIRTTIDHVRIQTKALYIPSSPLKTQQCFFQSISGFCHWNHKIYVRFVNRIKLSNYICNPQLSIFFRLGLRAILILGCEIG